MYKDIHFRPFSMFEFMPLTILLEEKHDQNPLDTDAAAGL